MDEQQQKELIPDLDQFAARAAELAKELGCLLDRHLPNQDERLAQASNTAYKLVRSLKEASDALKRERAHLIEAYVTAWYRFRVEDEEGVVHPDYKSVTYDGENTWTLVMTTPTHGKERVVVHSDTASWDQVYSAEPL